MSITIQDKLTCVVRELGYRRRVYPRLIANNKMGQSQADKEIKLMEAIVDDYRRSAQVCAGEQSEMFTDDAA